MLSVVLLITLNLFVNGLSSPRTYPVVQTKVGAIRGRLATDGDYAMFKGIPYAKIDPNNPFSPSLARPPFETTYDAINDTARCPQVDITGTLDCLQLSIFVPTSASVRNPLPVMMWFHGGAFHTGSFDSSKSGPKYLVKHGVILVLFNYRVTLYGFMCLDIPEVPGNAGLRDQAAAIKWIKENIAAFGGDDNNITLFGESAGAALVDLQFRYNKDDDFHKVIMQSGTAAGSWGGKRPDHSLAIKVANQLGFQTSNSLDAVKFLTTQSPSNVVPAFQQMSLEIGPCVEQQFIGVDRFINDYAMNLEIPRAKDTPILIGYTDDEWLLKYINKTPEYFETLSNFKNNLLEVFDLHDEELKEVESVIKRFYLGDEHITQDKFHEIANFDTDFYIIHPMETAINQYIKNGGFAIYRFYFTYVGVRNRVKYEMNITSGGAVHGDVKGYLFDITALPEPNEEDQLMIDRITTMWTNFAKYGNPTPETTELLPTQWPVVNKEASYYLEMDKEFVIKKNPLHDRVAFWDLVYLLNETKQVGYKPTAKISKIKN